jgi:hypothetical protein
LYYLPSTNQRRSCRHRPAFRKKLHDPRLPHLGPSLLEILLGLVRPVHVPDHSIREDVDVHSDILVDLLVPRRQLLVLCEARMCVLALGPDKVDRGLYVEIVLEHDDCDHVGYLALGSFDVVREILIWLHLPSR